MDAFGDFDGLVNEVSVNKGVDPRSQKHIDLYKDVIELTATVTHDTRRRKGYEFVEGNKYIEPLPPSSTLSPERDTQPALDDEPRRFAITPEDHFKREMDRYLSKKERQTFQKVFKDLLGDMPGNDSSSLRCLD